GKPGARYPQPATAGIRRPVDSRLHRGRAGVHLKYFVDTHRSNAKHMDGIETWISRYLSRLAASSRSRGPGPHGRRGYPAPRGGAGPQWTAPGPATTGTWCAPSFARIRAGWLTWRGYERRGRSHRGSEMSDSALPHSSVMRPKSDPDAWGK